MRAPHDIVLRRVLVGHRAAVNVVDFDDRYIVSASGDRTIKVCRGREKGREVFGVALSLVLTGFVVQDRILSQDLSGCGVVKYAYTLIVCWWL